MTHSMGSDDYWFCEDCRQSCRSDNACDCCEESAATDGQYDEGE